MSLLLNMLSRFVITFLPRRKRLLISWLQAPSAVILEPKKIKYLTVSIVSPSICHGVMGPDAIIFVSWMLSFKPAFSLSSFIYIKRLLLLFTFFCKGGVIYISEVIDISPCDLDSSLCFIQSYGTGFPFPSLVPVIQILEASFIPFFPVSSHQWLIKSLFCLESLDLFFNLLKKIHCF